MDRATELVVKMKQEGHFDHFAEVLALGDKILWKQVHFYADKWSRNEEADREDLATVARLAAWKAVNDFEPEHGLNFWQYAFHRVGYSVRSAARAQHNATKRLKLTLDNPNSAEKPCEAEEKPDEDWKVELNQAVFAYLKGKNEQEVEIFQGILYPKHNPPSTYQEIGDKFRISKQRANQIAQKMLVEFKSYLERNHANIIHAA